MARGIQLKRLSIGDLTALGLPESALRDLQTPEPSVETTLGITPQHPAVLVREARAELQAVRALLDEALNAARAGPGKAARR